MQNNYEHEYIDTNDISIHVVKHGPENEPLTILLHGFPDFWYGWRYQIPRLALSNLRIWAPDQRGYNLSDKPEGVEEYKLPILANDIIGLVEASGRDKINLIGHDWGGAVAWWIASQYPDRIRTLININIPHGTVFKKYIRNNPGQVLKSWYMFFFQLPWFPEWMIQTRNYYALRRSLTKSSQPDTFSEDDLMEYTKAWSRTGAVTGMLNWYRSMFRHPPKRVNDSTIDVPTLLIWGSDDHFLNKEMASKSIDMCSHGRLEFFDDSTHWVHMEESERVNELIIEFLDETNG